MAGSGFRTGSSPGHPRRPVESDVLWKRARLLAVRASDALARDLNDVEALAVTEDLFAAALFAAAYLLSHPNQAALLGRMWEKVMRRQ
jgi:hypothetical protein